MDTTANGPAPSAQELGARRDEEELAQVISSIRRRKSTDLAEAAMSSKGDVTKMAGYQNLVMCLTQLRALEASAGNGSMGPGLRASSDALAALVRHKASPRRGPSPCATSTSARLWRSGGR
jgi:hypothetical protein